MVLLNKKELFLLEDLKLFGHVNHYPQISFFKGKERGIQEIYEITLFLEQVDEGINDNHFDYNTGDTMVNIYRFPYNKYMIDNIEIGLDVFLQEHHVLLNSLCEKTAFSVVFKPFSCSSSKYTGQCFLTLEKTCEASELMDLLIVYKNIINTFIKNFGFRKMRLNKQHDYEFKKELRRAYDVKSIVEKNMTPTIIHLLKDTGLLVNYAYNIMPRNEDDYLIEFLSFSSSKFLIQQRVTEKHNVKLNNLSAYGFELIHEGDECFLVNTEMDISLQEALTLLTQLKKINSL